MYCYEYQTRGSTHAHGCAKLKNDHGICTLVERASAGWLAEQQLLTSTDSNTCAQFTHAIRDANNARAEALEYANWLVTTRNSSLPEDTWALPVPHPCAVHIHDISDFEHDHQDLVNSVQRHTRCGAAYCLRSRPGQQGVKCHFHYPCPLQELSTIEFEQLGDGSIRATLTTRQDDPRINSHNRVMLQHWHAHVDLQIIVDVQACARYMAKYAAKGEP